MPVLKVGVDQFIESYYSLVTNSIHECDFANSYIHLRAEEKMSAIQNDRDHCSPLSSRSMVVDGGWLERSHKHSYNAKSGVAVVLGVILENYLLFMGIRNKFVLCVLSQ